MAWATAGVPAGMAVTVTAAMTVRETARRTVAHQAEHDRAEYPGAGGPAEGEEGDEREVLHARSPSGPVAATGSKR